MEWSAELEATAITYYNQNITALEVIRVHRIVLDNSTVSVHDCLHAQLFVIYETASFVFVCTIPPGPQTFKNPSDRPLLVCTAHSCSRILRVYSPDGVTDWAKFQTDMLTAAAGLLKSWKTAPTVWGSQRNVEIYVPQTPSLGVIFSRQFNKDSINRSNFYGANIPSEARLGVAVYLTVIQEPLISSVKCRHDFALESCAELWWNHLLLNPVCWYRTTCLVGHPALQQKG